MGDVQVMQTERLIYLVTEYANGGEIFGKSTVSCILTTTVDNDSDVVLNQLTTCHISNFYMFLTLTMPVLPA